MLLGMFGMSHEIFLRYEVRGAENTMGEVRDVRSDLNTNPPSGAAAQRAETRAGIPSLNCRRSSPEMCAVARRRQRSVYRPSEWGTTELCKKARSVARMTETTGATRPQPMVWHTPHKRPELTLNLTRLQFFPQSFVDRMIGDQAGS